MKRPFLYISPHDFLKAIARKKPHIMAATERETCSGDEVNRANTHMWFLQPPRVNQ